MLTRYGRHFYTPLHGDAWANARLLVDSGSEHPPLISQTLSDTSGLLCEVFPIYLSSPTRNRARLHCPCIKSDFRLGGRPISKMLETGPGRCRRAKCEVRIKNKGKNCMSDLTKISKKCMSDLTRNGKRNDKSHQKNKR